MPDCQAVLFQGGQTSGHHCTLEHPALSVLFSKVMPHEIKRSTLFKYLYRQGEFTARSMWSSFFSFFPFSEEE